MTNSTLQKPGGSVTKQGDTLSFGLTYFNENRYNPTTADYTHLVSFKRYTNTDATSIAGWSNTSAPSPAQAISLSSPTPGSTVPSNKPWTIWVNAPSGAAYTILIDGQPANPNVTSLSEGLHTIVAYLNSDPKYRHTVQVNAVRVIDPDQYEDDNTEANWKPLYGDLRKYHNFHVGGDTDWSAFVVPPGLASTVTMTGGNFGVQCSLKLYFHTTTSRTLVQSKTGNCTNLSVAHASPNTAGTYAYTVEAKLLGEVNGVARNYSLLLTSTPTAITPDAYESDDDRSAYKLIYEGSPQAHNFHAPFDSDWVAFASPPNSRVGIRASGYAASRATLRLYRQDNYPNGEVVLVGEQTNGQSVLEVHDIHSNFYDFTAYFVEVVPSDGTMYGGASDYQLEVFTLP